MPCSGGKCLQVINQKHHNEKVTSKSSVQFSHSVVSDSLWPPGLQHTRPPLSITNVLSLLKLVSIESMMASNYLILCHPLLLLPSIFPSIRVFFSESALRMRWPNYWSLASASVLPMNIQNWFLLGWTGWISLLPEGLSRVFSNTTVQSIKPSVLSFLYSPNLTSIHNHWKKP